MAQIVRTHPTTGIAALGVSRGWGSRTSNTAAALAVLLVTIAASCLLRPASAACAISSGKTYFASSQYDKTAHPTLYDPPSAGDGSTSTFFHSNTGDYQPWLAIDLGIIHVVTAIKIVNRPDCCTGVTSCCSNRLQNAQVRVHPYGERPSGLGTLPGGWTGLCWYQRSLRLAAGATWNVNCNTPQIGQYVSLQNGNGDDATGYFLHVAEFAAYGYPNNVPAAGATVVSGGKVYKASSVYQGSATYAASKAGDGVTSTFFNSGVGDTTPWLCIDLGSSYVITAIGFTNRADCCAGRLANAVSYVTTLAPGVTDLVVNGTTLPTDDGFCYMQGFAGFALGQTYRPICDRMLIGRYVYIYNGNRASTTEYFLNLAEFFAYGYKPNLSTCTASG